MNPASNDPYHYSPPAAAPSAPAWEPPPAPVPAPELMAADFAALPSPAAPAPDAPLVGEVLPPEAPAPETPPSVPQYPIGLIDFNQPIIVVDGNNDEDVFDNPGIITVLKGSLHPVVISFWAHGEQRIAQFDTDGDSSCGDYKLEQDQPYPRTLYVVIGREGRNLMLDPDLYASEDAANEETNLDDIAGIFPIVVQAKVEEEAPVSEPVSDFHDGGVESEEQEDEVEDTASNVTDINQPPTEMYVAGRTRRVGETVHAYRNGFGVRVCTIVKMRRDARKSLFIDPKDGNDPYWALNKNVRY